MSFLHDKNFYLPLIDEYISKYAQAQAPNINTVNTVNALAKKLINNLEQQINDPVSSTTNASLGIINLSSLDNFIKYIQDNGIKVNNKYLLINADQFQDLSKADKRSHAPFKEYFINKDLFKQYMERLKTKASNLKSNPDTSEAGQNFQSLISKLITEINQISPDMKLSAQFVSEQQKEEQKSKTPIIRITLIDKISNVFSPNTGDIKDGDFELKYFNIESSSNFNNWIQSSGIKIKTTINDQIKEISLTSPEGKQYLEPFLSALLNRAEIQHTASEDKSIKQIYIDKIIQISKEYGITSLSSSLQTQVKQQGQQKTDSSAQQASYTPGSDVSAIQTGTPAYKQLQESISRIMEYSPLENGVIKLSDLDTFSRYLFSLQDQSISPYASKITQYTTEIRKIRNEDIIDLNAPWARTQEGTYQSPFPELTDNRQLCTYLLQATYIINAVRSALLAFNRRYKRFFDSDSKSQNIVNQQIGSGESIAGSAYSNNIQKLETFRIRYARCPS